MGIERILAELAQLNEEVAASPVTPPDLVDASGRRWSWKQGDLYRDGKGSCIPRALMAEPVTEAAS